jgi:hypothetical protein
MLSLAVALGAASPAAGASWDRSVCPPEISSYGGCPVRVYVAPVRPGGFHEQTFGIVRKGYDLPPEADTRPVAKTRRGLATTPR